jgi:hypothetical protein
MKRDANNELLKLVIELGDELDFYSRAVTILDNGNYTEERLLELYCEDVTKILEVAKRVKEDTLK